MIDHDVTTDALNRIISYSYNFLKNYRSFKLLIIFINKNIQRKSEISGQITTISAVSLNLGLNTFGRNAEIIERAFLFPCEPVPLV